LQVDDATSELASAGEAQATRAAIIKSFFIVLLHRGRSTGLSQNRTAATFQPCRNDQIARFFASFERRMEKIANSGPDEARLGWSVRHG
jgi:hypothetical protein